MYSWTRIHFVDDHLFPLITGQPPKQGHPKTHNKCTHLMMRKMTLTWELQNIARGNEEKDVHFTNQAVTLAITTTLLTHSHI